MYRHTESWLLKADRHMTGLNSALAGPQLLIRLFEWSSLLWIGIYPKWWASLHRSSLLHFQKFKVNNFIYLPGQNISRSTPHFPALSLPVFSWLFSAGDHLHQLLMAERWSSFHPCFLHTHIHTVTKLGYFLPPSYFSNLSTSTCRYNNFLKFPYLFPP